MYLFYDVDSPSPFRRTLEVLSIDNTTSSNNLTLHGLRLLIAYDVLYVLGFVSLMVVVLTAWLAKSAKRSSLWLSAVSSWALIAFANMLLLGQQTGAQPNRHFCLMQATLIYATPAYGAMANTVYMIQAYCSTCSSISLNRLSRSQKFIAFLHSISGTVLVFVILEVIIVGQIHKDTIQRDSSGMYCHLTSSIPYRTTAAITIFGVAVILILEGCIIFIIQRSTQKLKDVRRVASGSQAIRLSQNDFSREAFIRIACFSSWGLVCVVLSSMAYLPQRKMDYQYAQIIQSTLPCVATVTFGTQRDVIKAWKFWKKKNIRTQAAEMPKFDNAVKRPVIQSFETDEGDSIFQVEAQDF